MGKRGDQKRKKIKEERKQRRSQLALQQPEPPPIILPPQESISWRRRISGKVKAVVGGVVTCLTLYVTFFPHWDVSGREALNPTDPSSAHVTFTNSGWYTFKDVSYSCIQVVGKGREGARFEMNRIDNDPEKRKVGELPGGQPMTAHCDDMHFGGSPEVNLEFMVQIWFRPWFVPRWIKHYWTRTFLFVAVCGADGRFRIEPQRSLPIPERLNIDPDIWEH